MNRISAPGRLHFKRVPTESELMSIPVAQAGEFELSDKELRRLRQHVYAINRDGIRRFRTMKDGPLVMVWRIK